MTNKIMALADALTYTRLFVQEGLSAPEEVDAARTALAIEVQAQQDYTRAVISERDALKGELEVARAWLHEADVADKNLRIAIAKVHAAKGRHHTQLAMCDLLDSVGVKNERPVK